MDLELNMIERIANKRRQLKNLEQTQILSIWYVLFDNSPEPMSIDYE